ncbi:hypothetical protein GCM10017668_52210 [Streptomyces tuirus]|uniref:Uncharacterized protein n=1 Tax=Streptomyces tuirus TaxID=68278 RepID=A0A7G1NJT0_9ACTN|nr:hypothetical protein GCM10017668_52210 [Streptomyces tuirus]
MFHQLNGDIAAQVDLEVIVGSVGHGSQGLPIASLGDATLRLAMKSVKQGTSEGVRSSLQTKVIVPPLKETYP